MILGLCSRSHLRKNDVNLTKKIPHKNLVKRWCSTNSEAQSTDPFIVSTPKVLDQNYFIVNAYRYLTPADSAGSKPARMSRYIAPSFYYGISTNQVIYPICWHLASNCGKTSIGVVFYSSSTIPTSNNAMDVRFLPFYTWGTISTLFRWSQIY